MPTNDRSFAADLRQAMTDWDNATEDQQREALAIAAAAAEKAGGFGIEATRSRASVFGGATAWVKGRDGIVERYPTLEDAQTEAERLNRAIVSPNVYYVAKPFGRGEV